MGIGRENPVGESRGVGRANAQRAYANQNVIHKMWIIAGPLTRTAPYLIAAMPSTSTRKSGLDNCGSWTVLLSAEGGPK